MTKHECIIGMYNMHDCSENIPLSKLIEWVNYYKELDDINDGAPFKLSRFTLSDYLDGRKSTNLERYKYCPECGAKINWKQMREENIDGYRS